MVLNEGLVLTRHFTKDYNGSAMSVGSFAAYASVFWAYALNGWIIDTYPAIQAYQMIFGIGLTVSILGMVCSLALITLKKKQSAQPQEENLIESEA